MKRMIPLFAATALVFAAGCSTPPPPPEEAPRPYFPAVNTVTAAETVAPPHEVAWKMVEMDPTFSSYLVVSTVVDSRTKDGFKSVHVLVKNLSNIPVRAAYRFEWTGPDGIRVVDPYHDTWETATFQAGDEGEFSSIAPKKNCEDFKLRFRAIQ